MTLNHCFKIHGLILVTTLSAVTGFVSPAFGEETPSYLIDLNSRTATELSSLSLGGYSPNFINDSGQMAGNFGEAPTQDFITGPNGIGPRGLGTLGA
jgi:hypothetical protein